MSERKVPITLITGFLESGKTTAIMDIVRNGLADFNGDTLILDIEEPGEAVYDDEILKQRNIVLVNAENPALLTSEFLQELEDAYVPDQIFIEYNGTFKVQYLEELVLPKGWEIVRQITLVDASCFALYMRNLKPMFEDMIAHTDLVLFNRCQKELPLLEYEDIIRNVNTRAKVVFEAIDGAIL